MKIEETILKLKSVLSESKKLPGFKNKVILDAEEISSILDNLSDSVPGEMTEAQEIITQRESVINQAHLEARRIRETSQKEAAESKDSLEMEHQKLVSETEVLKTAHNEAEVINSDAMAEAEKINQNSRIIINFIMSVNWHIFKQARRVNVLKNTSSDKQIIIP